MDQRGVVKYSLNFLSIFLNFNLIINDQLGCKIDDSWKYTLLHKNPVIRGLLQNKKYKNDWLADRLTLHFCLILILSILLRLLLSTSFDFNFIIVQTLYPQLFAGCFICEIFWASGFTACCCMINQEAKSVWLDRKFCLGKFLKYFVKYSFLKDILAVSEKRWQKCT